MNLFTITCIITFITNLFIAILFLVKVKNKSIGHNFGWTSLASFTWAFGALFLSMSESKESAIFWLKIAHTGIILTPTFFTHFVTTYTNIKARLLKIFLYLLSITYLFFNYFYPNFYKVELVFNQFYFFKASFTDNPLYTIYYITYYWIVLLYGFFLLLRHFTKTTGNQRNQVKYFIVGMIVAWLGPEGMFLLVFGLPLYPYSNLLIAAYPLILAYAILRYRLMDINIALTRVGTFITVYSIILGIPFWVGIKYLGRGPWLVPTSICAVLATVCPFIFLLTQRRIEGSMLQKERDSHALLEQASSGMISIKELQKILKLTVDLVIKILKFKMAAVFLLDDNAEMYVLKASNPNGIGNITIDVKDPMVERLKAEKNHLIYDELRMSDGDKNDLVLKQILTRMKSLSAKAAMPIIMKENLLGFLILGERESDGIFTEDLLRTLSVLCNQSALAIVTAILLEETEKDLAQRSHESRLKAIGAMGSGVAHQIRNRFNIMSGYTSAFIVMLKKIDLKNQPNEKLVELVEKAKKIMEKILENTMQGEKICVAINSYSKLTEEKESAEFGAIIEMAVDLLRGRVDFDKLELVKDFPDNVKIYCIVPMIQDIFVNLIVNSRDAMQAKLNYIKRGEWNFPDYAPRITIKGTVNKDKLIVDFSDNGTGFKPGDEQNAFVPFYTTKGTGIKGKDGGTGLGLHLIWDFLKKNNGDLQLINKYQEGVTFRITLPLAKNERES